VARETDGPLRTLVVGDRFVPPAVLSERLLAAGERAELAFDIRHIDLPYPTSPAIPVPPLRGGTEVRGFWEEVDAIAARADDDAADPTIREYTGPVDALVPEVEGVEILLLHTAPISRAVVDAADGLRAVGTVRTGPVNVNIEALSDRGIPLFNCPGRNATAVAEFITGALIAHVRRIAETARQLTEGRWSLAPWWIENAGMELRGKTCGLVGFGQVGHAFAPIALGLGMELLATDPYVEPDHIRAGGAERVELEDLFRRSDVVILVARLTFENRHLVDRDALALMKPTAILVNAARSPLVDTEALAEALREGRIAGAVVDVFDQEPPPADSLLLSAPHTLLTPHIAGATSDTVHRGAEMIADSIVGYLRDGSLEHCVNAEALKRSVRT
jgi:D-3-phosphoglycerate dehydrogenase